MSGFYHPHLSPPPSRGRRIRIWIPDGAGALFASTVFYLMPVFGMLSGIVFLGDRINASQITGIVIVLLGIYLIDREKFRKE